MKLVDKIRLWFWTSPHMDFISRLWCPFMHVKRFHMQCEHGGVPCVKGCYEDAERWKCPACGVEYDNQLILDDHVAEAHETYKQAKEKV